MKQGSSFGSGAAIAAILSMALTMAPAHAQQRINGYFPHAERGASVLGRLSANEPVRLTLSLPLRNESELQDLISRLYDPTDPVYREYLTPESFTARFGPTQADYDTVASYAVAHGLAIVGTPPNRLLLDVAGPAHAVENAFGVSLYWLKARDGRIFRAPDRNPTVPDYVASRMTGVFGLDTSLVPHPQLQRLPRVSPGSSNILTPNQIGTGPGGALTPTDIRTAYNLNGSAIPTGAGQTLGLFELDGYTASDITSYESYYGITPAPLQNVLVDGFSGSPGTGADEVTLDIELMTALAAGVNKIVVYEASDTFSASLDTYNQIATDDVVKTVSSSWGLPENEVSFAASAENSIFAEMAAQGQSLFVSAGDTGAYDDGSTLSVDDPASQPYVVGVGGTKLSVKSGEIYAGESAWNEGSGSAGGGGISDVWGIPSWQQGVIFPASLGSMTMRNVPDVSLDADPYTGYSIYYGGGWTIYGGTSCAAPLWAAYATLANQARTTLGEGLLGFPNPLLYQIGAGANYGLDFHDIADGSTNLYYPAVTGYDDATGWGTFNGAELLADLAPGFPRPPVTPSGLIITSGDKKLSLSWTASSGAASYNVKRSTTSGGPYTTMASPTTNNYVNTGLTDGTTYYYVISAVNGSGESANSSQISGVPLASSTATAVFLRTDTTTQGNWKGVYGADGYNVFEDSASGPAYAQTTPSASKRDYTWNSSPTAAQALLRGSTT
ncbi:MAG TPA: protease pro-enzyme activation domain-containing protein, partial [Armatimonadota bacterium]|nr:protease pro-enzyme activation domain-containing protein [Armatimonadota bacterium]